MGEVTYLTVKSNLYYNFDIPNHASYVSLNNNLLDISRTDRRKKLLKKISKSWMNLNYYLIYS